jgi:hypothetical protein
VPGLKTVCLKNMYQIVSSKLFEKPEIPPPFKQLNSFYFKGLTISHKMAEEAVMARLLISFTVSLSMHKECQTQKLQ